MKRWQNGDAEKRAERISQDLWDQLANRPDFDRVAPATFEALAKECQQALEQLGKAQKK